MSPSGRYVLSGTDPNATTYHHITPPYYTDRKKHDFHLKDGTMETSQPKILKPFNRHELTKAEMHVNASEGH